MTPGRARLLALVGMLVLAAAALAQSPYYVYVSNEYGADISVIDGRSDEVVDTISISGHPGDVRPRGMAVSPDGSVIYVSVSDFFPQTETPEDKITAIDVETNEILVEIRAGGNPERVAIGPAGDLVWASLEAIAQGGVYEAATGERLAAFQVGIEPEGVGASPDGRWAYITAETTHTVAVVDARNLEVQGFVLVGNRPRVVVFARDSSRAYVSAEIGGTVSVIDTATHAVVESVPLGLDSRPVGMALSPDGARLYVAGGGTSAIYVIDTRNHQVEAVIRERMGRRPWDVAVSPDGTKAYTSNGLSDSVSVIDTQCLCVVDEIAVGRGPHSLAIGTPPGER